MYIKIQKEKIIILMLLLLLLNSISFFYQGFTLGRWIPLILLFSTVVLSIITYQNKIVVSHFIKYYSVIAFCSILLIVLYTCIHYNQNFSSAFNNARPYLLILLAIPMSLIIDDKGNWDYFLKIVNYIALIWYIIVILQYILFSISGTIIIPDYYTDNVANRNGHIRVYLPPYGHYMFIYNIYMFLVRKRRQSIPFLVMGVICLVVVEQTRAAEAIIAAIFIVCWILSRDQVSKRMIAIIVVILAGALLLVLGVDEMILNSFSLTGDNAGSTIARLYAVDYYLECFMKNPFCGFGFTNNPEIINGPLGIAWPSDVGIIGQLAKIGVFILPLYLPIIIWIGNICLNKKYQNNCRLFAFLNLIFLIMSSASLIIFDYERAILTPIIISSINCFCGEERNGE